MYPTKNVVIVGLQIVTLVALLLTATSSQAQAWKHGKKALYSVGLGGAQGILVGSSGGFGAISLISPIALSLNVSGEYGVGKFIGIGWQTGLNTYFGFGTALEIPLAGKVNVHLMDAFNASIKDKLDVYAGFGLGGGPVFDVSGGGVYGVIHVGPQLGARYWVSDKVAVFGEFGWGNTFANFGVTF